MKSAIITGVTGQDGSYLAELLLAKGYEVHGLIRYTSTPCTERIDHIKDKNFYLHFGDMTDALSLMRLIREIQPDEVYNLAAQSSTGLSFKMPEYTAQVNGLGALKLLEAIRQNKPDARYYQAATSQLFDGTAGTAPQSEKSPLHPKNPYAMAKLYAYFTTINYREAFGLFACNGITFNHESPRRGIEFVTRKISIAVAKISAGLQEKFALGDLDSKRDWGCATDYVKAMWLILQQDKPDDFVLATGETHTLREFVALAFEEIGIQIEWRGKGLDEKAYCTKSGKVLVEVDPKYFRPAEADLFLGDPSKAQRVLGWQRQVSFRDLVKMMVQADLKLYGR